MSYSKNWTSPKKCPRCHKATKKADGEGYDVMADEHIKFRLGRICESCKMIYLNPKYVDFEIIQNSDVGA